MFLRARYNSACASLAVPPHGVVRPVGVHGVPLAVPPVRGHAPAPQELAPRRAARAAGGERRTRAGVRRRSQLGRFEQLPSLSLARARGRTGTPRTRTPRGTPRAPAETRRRLCARARPARTRRARAAATAAAAARAAATAAATLSGGGDFVATPPPLGSRRWPRLCSTCARRDLVQTRLLRGDFRERRRGRDRRLGRQATLLGVARLARRADPLHREIRALERQRQRVVVKNRGRSRSARPGSRPSPSRTRWSS